MSNFIQPDRIRIYPSYVNDQIIPIKDMLIQKIPQIKGEPLCEFLQSLDSEEEGILRSETYGLDARVKKLDEELFDLQWSMPLTTGIFVGIGALIPVVGWAISAYGIVGGTIEGQNQAQSLTEERNEVVSNCATTRWKRLNIKTINLKSHIEEIENQPGREKELTQCKTAYIFIESKKILFMVK